MHRMCGTIGGHEMRGNIGGMDAAPHLAAASVATHISSKRKQTIRPAVDTSAVARRTLELQARGPPWVCTQCGKDFKMAHNFAAHAERGCHLIHCKWCNTQLPGDRNRVGAPGGDEVFCTQCGSLSRAGHETLPQPHADGNYRCVSCSELFTKLRALSIHARYCRSDQSTKKRHKPSNGVWRCEWCNINETNVKGRAEGPNGEGTLCGGCNGRFSLGHRVPPARDLADQKFVCEDCGWKAEAMRNVVSHQRTCTGGQWRCDWCSISEADARGKAAGPQGESTLCIKCGSRFQNGYTKPIVDDVTGRLVCDACTRSFETFTALAGYGARFSAEMYIRGCHWIPRMFA
jgi:hypothetical protein